MPQIRLLDRREFLKLSGVAVVAPTAALSSRVLGHNTTDGTADYTLRIQRAQVELAPHHLIATTTYNGQFPGPWCG